MNQTMEKRRINWIQTTSFSSFINSNSLLITSCYNNGVIERERKERQDSEHPHKGSPYQKNNNNCTDRTIVSANCNNHEMIEKGERVIFLFCLSSFLFISCQLIQSSDVIMKLKYIRSVNTTPGYKVYDRKPRQQRICILAGPHKTGTSSVQENMYQWSKFTRNSTFSSNQNTDQKGIINWVWPIPEVIAEIESNDAKTWNWTPAKVFYPMMEAMAPLKKKHKRNLFKQYAQNNVTQMYRETLSTHWNQGEDIVFGTEAMDMIVKFPHGSSMLHTISDDILPNAIEGDQITAVIMYRTPKINHLVSIWHENCNKATDPKFYEWITTSENTFGPVDSLGMVDLMLKETNWKIVLIDLNLARLDGWDISNFVACKVMGEDCVNKALRGLNGAEPVVKNVRRYDRDPNVPNITLDEMDSVLRSYDCNYQHIFDNIKNSYVGRLEIAYPDGFHETMAMCRTLSVDGYPSSRVEMKQQIGEVAVKYGKLW